MEEEQKIEEDVTAELPKSSKIRDFFRRLVQTKKRKIFLVVLSLLVVVGALFAVPVTRYALLSPLIKKDITITVVDKTTKKPVSLATVTVGSVSGKTSNSGEVVLKSVPVGQYSLKVEKKYFTSYSQGLTVPVVSAPEKTTVNLVATGRQVAVVVINTITRLPVAGATITVKDAEAKTDEKGAATIVLPVGKDELEGEVKANSYNTNAVKVAVSEASDKNHFTLTPTGRLYYLSKQTGKINVMAANLDGTASEVVVTASGNEKDGDTVLLAARDWKYLALQAKRSASAVAQLYLLDATSKQLKLIDEGDVTFTLVGWSGHNFIYQLYRNNKQSWDPKQQALKSYNAETGKLTVIDETQAAGSSSYDFQQENMISPYILENKIVYAKGWWFGQQWSWTGTTDKKMTITAVNPDGGNKQVVKSFDMTPNGSIQGQLYAPQEIYYRVAADGSKADYFEYEDGAVKTASATDDTFYNSQYSTYLMSPSGNRSFWFEPRDGKNTLFVGDKNGANGKELANQSEYKSYGWYGDEYILLSKNGSELFVAPSDTVFSVDAQPLKVTNYHKPNVSYPGYGYGYGGI